MATTDESGVGSIPSSTELALERTHLAHERTLMAWVRTAVSLISFGFTIYKFFQYMQEQNKGETVSRPMGPRQFAMMMIGIGLVSLLLATVQHLQTRKKLREKFHEIPFSLSTVIAGLFCVLGILAFIAVIFRQ